MVLLIYSGSAQSDEPAQGETTSRDSFAPAETLRTLLNELHRCDAQRIGPTLLAESERVYGRESIETAEVLDQLARAFAMPCTVTWWGQADTIFGYLERSVQIKEQLLGPESTELAEGLDLLGEKLCSAAKVKFTGVPENACERGTELRDRALEIWEQALGEEHPDNLERRADRAVAHGDTATARALYEQAIATRESSLGPSDPKVADSILKLARFLWDQERDDGASKQHFARAISILESDPIANARPLARVLIWRADMVWGRDWAEVQQYYERSIEVLQAVYGPDSPHLLQSLNNLKLAYFMAGGHFEEQLELATRALTIARKHRAVPNAIALQLWSLAQYYWFTGDVDESFRLMDETILEYEKVIPPDNIQFMVVLTDLADRQLDMGDYEAAERSITRSIDIAENADISEEQRALLGDWPLVWKGKLLLLRGQYTEAIEVLEKSTANEAMRDWYGGTYHAQKLGYLADAHLAVEHVNEADSLYEEMLAIWEKQGDNHPYITWSKCGLGKVQLARGNFAAASQQLEAAADNARVACGPDHPDVARALAGLAEARVGLGDQAGALAAALEAERISIAQARLVAQSMSERQALRYAQVRWRGMDLALSLAARGLTADEQTRVWDVVVRSRAQVIDELAARNRAVAFAATGDVELIRLHEELRAASERLANLMVRRQGSKSSGDEGLERQLEQLNRARDEKERAERALADHSTAYRSELARAQLGLEDVRTVLQPGDALVAYVRYADTLPDQEAIDAYLAFVMSGQQLETEVIPLGPAEDIDRKIAAWRSAIRVGASSGQKSEAAYRDAGAALREITWDPLLAALDGARRVYFVPDGSLNLVSFSALPDDKGKYLLERDFSIHYLTAERDLVPQETPVAVGRGLLAMGGPAYDARPGVATSETAIVDPAVQVYRGARSSCAGFQGGVFEPLPGTSRELEEIRELWQATHTASTDGKLRQAGDAPANLMLSLMGSQASETAFKTQAPGREVLHLATHGFFLGGECQSALERSRAIQTVVMAEPPPAEGENPLILSGLALAGANRREEAQPGEEDGILTAEEIAALDLSGVQWAVLSACETGVGRVQAGEGVFGLRRAFQVAGAKTLIMSLWSVEDEATREWMKHLYEARLVDRLDTAESVRQASLAVLNERRANGESTHPFYWGAFVAAGDWR